MQYIKLPAPAKLNLFLHILGRRVDGYHNIQTVFQFVDCCDQIGFRVCDDPTISLTPRLMGVATKDNLIYRAAMLLQEATQCRKGADIVLQKNLPLGGGLGGGSSDAATTLWALNKLWQLQLKEAELIELGRHLGADVPIFIHGHAAWAEGIGDQFTSILLPQPWYVLLVPPCHVSSAELYQDPELTRNSDPLKIDGYRVGQGHNDFTEVVCKRYPAVAEAIRWLGQFGSARMTGSGAVVFAAFDSEQEAGRIAAQVPKTFRAIVARGVNRSPLLTAL